MRLLLLLLSITIMSCGSAQKVAQSISYPVIKLADDNINVGDLVEGESVTMLFSLTNVGDADLVIELVTACKCTSLDWTRGKIAPGDKGEIYVTFDSTGYDGLVEKTVDIISNVEAIVVEAHFRANVIKKP